MLMYVHKTATCTNLKLPTLCLREKQSSSREKTRLVTNKNELLLLCKYYWLHSIWQTRDSEFHKTNPNLCPSIYGGKLDWFSPYTKSYSWNSWNIQISSRLITYFLVAGNHIYYSPFTVKQQNLITLFKRQNPHQQLNRRTHYFVFSLKDIRND